MIVSYCVKLNTSGRGKARVGTMSGHYSVITNELTSLKTEPALKSLNVTICRWCSRAYVTLVSQTSVQFKMED